jgi:hypothetical protein
MKLNRVNGKVGKAIAEVGKAIASFEQASVSLRNAEEELRRETSSPEQQDRVRWLAEEAFDVQLRVQEMKAEMERELKVQNSSGT